MTALVARIGRMGAADRTALPAVEVTRCSARRASGYRFAITSCTSAQ
ncbi:hypothetical protein [Gordonia insulae]|nr:hypothetical protein [Gordonia insulae]